MNETSNVWNPKLSAFRMVEEDELVSHGTCNTGVLLFDSLSLPRFMLGLSQVAAQNDSISTFYRNDRC